MPGPSLSSLHVDGPHVVLFQSEDVSDPSLSSFHEDGPHDVLVTSGESQRLEMVFPPVLHIIYILYDVLHHVLI